MADTSDGFIYGLDKFSFGGKVFGYISEEGMTPGGSTATKTQIRAAQAGNAVVKTLVTTPATKTFTFALIQLKTGTFVDVFGGEVDANGVYSAPAREKVLEDSAKIECVSGHVIDIAKASLTPSLAGAINLADVLRISCELEMLVPDDNESPYQITPPIA